MMMARSFQSAVERLSWVNAKRTFHHLFTSDAAFPHHRKKPCIWTVWHLLCVSFSYVEARKSCLQWSESTIYLLPFYFTFLLSVFTKMKPPPLPKFNVRTIMFSCRMHFHGDSGWEVVDITCPSHVLWMMHYQGIRKCEKEAPNKMVKTKLFIDIVLLKFNMLTTLCVKWWPV